MYIIGFDPLFIETNLHTVAPVAFGMPNCNQGKVLLQYVFYCPMSCRKSIFIYVSYCIKKKPSDASQRLNTRTKLMIGRFLS